MEQHDRFKKNLMSYSYRGPICLSKWHDIIGTLLKRHYLKSLWEEWYETTESIIQPSSVVQSKPSTCEEWSTKLVAFIWFALSVKSQVNDQDLSVWNNSRKVKMAGNTLKKEAMDIDWSKF